MSMQMAELHYVSTPSYDAASIVARAESLTRSGIELPQPKAESGTLLLFHARHNVQYSDAAAPAQTAILTADQPTDPANYSEAIEQSWTCDDADDRLRSCATSRLVTEMMAQALPPAERVMLFHGVLQAFVELTDPQAIVFKHSQQVVAPETYLASCDEPLWQRLGAVNVRFFRISNSDTDDMVMDTRGLDEIGLHDLQCHFRELDPSDVSAVLYNTAFYILENGSVIESGHTIPGAQPDSKWKCQFEKSLLDPQRELLDLNPGSPYAAGHR